MTTVVDSGACCTVASEHVISKLKLSETIRTYTGPLLKGANNAPLQMTGQVVATRLVLTLSDRFQLPIVVTNTFWCLLTILPAGQKF